MVFDNQPVEIFSLINLIVGYKIAWIFFDFFIGLVKCYFSGAFFKGFKSLGV